MISQEKKIAKHKETAHKVPLGVVHRVIESNTSITSNVACFNFSFDTRFRHLLFCPDHLYRQKQYYTWVTTLFLSVAHTSPTPPYTQLLTFSHTSKYTHPHFLFVTHTLSHTTLYYITLLMMYTFFDI